MDKCSNKYDEFYTTLSKNSKTVTYNNEGAMYFSNHVEKVAYRQKDNENVIDWGFFLSFLLSTLVSKILVFEKILHDRHR